MTRISKKDILQILEPKLENLGLSISDVDVKKSLLNQGILDSMTFLEFIVEIEEAYGMEIDLNSIDPSEFTSVEGILNLIQNGS